MDLYTLFLRKGSIFEIFSGASPSKIIIISGCEGIARKINLILII